MSGDWCITWERVAHVVKLDKGWYRISLYSAPEIEGYAVPTRMFLRAVYSTNRRDANNKAKLLVSGMYDGKLSQPRLF